jgi:hypothetical protein
MRYSMRHGPGETEGTRIWVSRVIVGGLSWLLFFVLVGSVSLVKGALDPLVLVLGPGMLVLTWLVTQAWVHHNVRIYRRKGARRGRPPTGGAWTHDRLDRPLSGSWLPDLRGHEVVVDVITTAVGVVKEYRLC